MKNITTLLLLTFFQTALFSQDFELLKNQIQDLSLQPENDNLEWIKTDYDFNQSNLSINEIDFKIDSIIKLQIKNDVEKIQTPINLKRLKYYGYYDFKKLGIIANNELFTTNPKEYAEANGAHNIYQYENITILNTYNAFEDQLNVYSIIRSFLILKNKYPIIYKDLIEDTETLNSTVVQDKSTLGTLNTNKHLVFSIHTNNEKSLNATTTNYGPKYKDPILNQWKAENVHLVFLNKETIRNGGVANGKKAIYNEVDMKSAQMKFLFDGLILTIIHERLHYYISNYMTINKFFDFVRNNNALVNDNKPTYDYMEEPIVTNTTNKLFTKYGGLSKDVMSYYKNLFFEYQIPEMKKNTKWNSLISKLDELNTKNLKKDYSSILNIYF